MLNYLFQKVTCKPGYNETNATTGVGGSVGGGGGQLNLMHNLTELQTYAPADLRTYGHTLLQRCDFASGNILKKRIFVSIIESLMNVHNRHFKIKTKTGTPKDEKRIIKTM